MTGSLPRIDVRKALPQDAALVRDCLVAAFEPYRQRYTPGGFQDTVPTLQGLEERFREMTVLVAVDESGAVVGTVAYQALESGEGHLRGMAVLPRVLGQGVAQRLLSAAESNLREQGCERVTLDTTGPLERATRFYRKQGYGPTGVVGDFFGMALFEYAKRL